MQQAMAGQLGPIRSENGDWLGQDNDGDGRPEPIFVRGHIRDGRYVRSHYRALGKGGNEVVLGAY